MINKVSDIPNIKYDIPLATYTTWKIGGPAKYFWEPTKELLPEVLSFCNDKNIKVWYLGRGSNVLIDSNGLDGLVICTKKALLNIKEENGIITAEAGVPMPALSKFAAKLGYGGYEYLIGIPGTIGGGISINAGLTANGRKEIGDVLIDVELINKKGNIFWEQKDELDLVYRGSNLQKRELFVLSARFKPTYISAEEEIKHKTADHLAERRRKQPLSKPTAGSTFKQPKGCKAAGWYIEKCGLKGKCIGGAKISEKHANWIETTKIATSDDVINLINHVKDVVNDRFNIFLEEEVVILK